MGPIRILGIAPYQGIASLMDTVCADRENVEIDTFVGDMAAGLQIAQQRLADPGADYDVILSRGGTAELIRQNTDLPVIDIPLSVYDILRTIKLAENYEFSYAIIGFPAITRNAAFVCDVLRYAVEIHTIHDLAEARGVLARLRDKDCRLLLCDVVTTSLAQEYGIPTILFTSGLESVGEALDEAVQQALHQRQIRTQEDFFCQTLQALPHDTLVLRPDGTALVSAVHDPLPDAVHKRAAALALSARPQTCAVEAEGRLYDLASSPVRCFCKSLIRWIVSGPSRPFSMASYRRSIFFWIRAACFCRSSALSAGLSPCRILSSTAWHSRSIVAGCSTTCWI